MHYHKKAIFSNKERFQVHSKTASLCLGQVGSGRVLVAQRAAWHGMAWRGGAGGGGRGLRTALRVSFSRRKAQSVSRFSCSLRSCFCLMEALLRSVSCLMPRTVRPTIATPANMIRRHSGARPRVYVYSAEVLPRVCVPGSAHGIVYGQK